LKKVALLLACVLVWLTSCSRLGPQQPPTNLLFIITDQHNAQSLGCAGSPDVKTPNLDRLAGEGVRFSSAFCQTAQCCPSRFSIWTGRYTRSHGVRFNSVREPLEEVTFAELLRDEGYATATIGKHHMSRSPKEHGFDEVVEMRDFDAAMQQETGRPWHRFVQWSTEFKPEDPARSGISPLSGDQHPAGFWTAKAIDFLRDNKDRPFCLWLSYFGPHPPIAPSPEFADLYAPEDLSLPANFFPERRRPPKPFERSVHRMYQHLDETQHRTLLAGYYGLVSQIDHNIGRVLDELDQLGLSERTAVIFTSDHGEMMAEHGLWNKQPLNHEGTVRVPLIVRAPGVQRGAVCDELVGLIDLMPTILEMCEQRVPGGVQGRSLNALLAGQAAEWRDVIFSEVAILNPTGWSLMARTKTRKYLLRRYEDGHSEQQLFDLEADPWERKDKFGSPAYSPDVEKLSAALANWEARTESAPYLPRDIHIVKAVDRSAIECELEFPDLTRNPFEAQLIVRTLESAAEPLRVLVPPGTELTWEPGALVSVDELALTVAPEAGSEARAPVRLYLKKPPFETMQAGGTTTPSRATTLLESLCQMHEVVLASDSVRQMAIWIAGERTGTDQLRHSEIFGENAGHPAYRTTNAKWVKSRRLVRESRLAAREDVSKFIATLEQLGLGNAEPELYDAIPKDPD